MIKAVIFDLDDTLYDESEYVMEGFRNVCSYLHENYCVDFAHLFERMKELLRSDGRGRIFNQICEEYNIPENIHALVEIYRNTKPKIHLYDDSIKCIANLKENHILTGLITDGLALTQHNKIEALELEKQLDYLIVTDDYGRENWKPSTYAYIKMAEHFKLRPQDMLYIGDNPLKDFIGAKKIGYHTMRIIRDKGDYMQIEAPPESNADYTITTLLSLLSYCSVTLSDPV